jgi:hypothetical protein
VAARIAGDGSLGDADSWTTATEEDAVGVDPRLAALARHWTGLHRDGRLPARTAIVPRALGPLLPYVVLVDLVEREPLRLRYRLVGTGVVRIVDEDNTGREVSSVFGGRLLEDTLADYRVAIAQRRPVWRRIAYLTPLGRPFEFERMMMPLASDGIAIDGFLGGVTNASSLAELR